MYILVEIRKMIEQERELREYFALDFYCSFALHTVMDREGARRILERFDRAHPLLVSKQRLPPELKKEIQDTTRLAKFREQLKAFIANNGLPDKLFADADAWPRFLHLYGNVIDECQLTMRADFAPMKNIERVVVSVKNAVLREAGLPEQVIFVLRWICYGKDGKSGTHETYFGYDSESGE